MKNITKRIFAICLAAMLLLSLAACGGKKDSESAGGDLLSAVQKLKQADSFRLVLSMDNTGETAGQPASRYVSEFSYQIKRNGIANDVQYEAKVDWFPNGESSPNVRENSYFSGKEAYILNLYSALKNVDKWISDENFSLDLILAETASLEVDTTKAGVLEKMQALSPKKTVAADGTATYELRNVAAADFAAVYAALSNEMSVEEITKVFSEDCELHLSAKVNKNGYFTELKLEMLNVNVDNVKQDMIITFTVDQINAIDKLEKPDYVKNFAVQEGMSLVQFSNGWTAQYTYDQSDYSADGGKMGFRLEGFGQAYDDAYTIDCYEVPAELEGKPVIRVAAMQNFGNVKVERVIVPAGVEVNLWESCEDTTFFFKDKEENVKKNFEIVGSQNGYAQAFVKAAYYEGQWEMKDGIPTAKN